MVNSCSIVAYIMVNQLGYELKQKHVEDHLTN